MLTSRIRPARLLGSVEVVAVHALPRDEAVLLVRELSNLRRLLDGKAPDVPVAQGRELVRRTLRVVQGHPKLIELAEGLAAEPSRLAAQLDRAETAQGQGASELDAFFLEGETRADADAFLASLRGWTDGITGALLDATRTFLHFLCAMEESDREGWIIERNWTDLWRRLSRPEPAPGMADMLAPLVAAGLVEEVTGANGAQFQVMIHPGVAEAGRAAGGGLPGRGRRGACGDLAGLMGRPKPGRNAGPGN